MAIAALKLCHLIRKQTSSQKKLIFSLYIFSLYFFACMHLPSMTIFIVVFLHTETVEYSSVCEWGWVGGRWVHARAYAFTSIIHSQDIEHKI